MEKFFPAKPEQKENEGKFSVERKFSVMHYESKWPPYDQRERGVKPEKKSGSMGDLLNKKIIRGMREQISNKLFASIEEIKEFITQFLNQRVTEEDFGEMASVKPTLTERFGRGKKFIEITVQWLDPNKDKPEYQDPKDPLKSIARHANDPWFSVKVVEKQ